METCIFCKIVRGELPSYKTYEDDKCIAFLDIRPVTAGHTLLVPKAHFPWIQDTPDDIISHCFIKSKDLINKIKDRIGADYVQLSIVGKDVPHFHIHLIPRTLSDGLDGWPTIELDKKDFDTIYEKLK